MKRLFFFLLSILMMSSLSGCTSMLVNSTKPVMTEMIVKPAFETFMTEDDIDLARTAIGGQIKLAEILHKSMKDDPEVNLLLCQGFGSFGQLLEPIRDEIKAKGTDESDEKAAALTARIRRLALRGRKYCFAILDKKYEGFSKAALKGSPKFNEILAKVSKDDVRYLFWLGYVWGFALVNGLTEPDMLAQIPQLKAIMEKSIELDSGFFYGAAHLSLGTLYAQSKMYGGDLKKSKKHFELAYKYSQRKMLLVHLYQARFYSNQTNNTKQCKALLNEILKQPKDLSKQLMLVNQIAKLQAKQALKNVDDFCP